MQHVFLHICILTEYARNPGKSVIFRANIQILRVSVQKVHEYSEYHVREESESLSGRK